MSSPAFATERIECPSCESVIPYQNVQSRIEPHPKVQGTDQRIIDISCDACGRSHHATLIKINGMWSPESCQPTTLKQSA